MSDDILRRAALALRRQQEGRSERAAETEERILSRVSERSLARRRRWTFLLPIAAVLCVASAWAGRHAGLWPDWPAPKPASSKSVPSPQVPRVSTKQPERAREPAAPETELSTALPLSPSVETRQGSGEKTPVSARAAPSRTARSEASANAGRAVLNPGLPANDVEALYREAHRLHFDGADAAAALAAWDRYLSAAPPGSGFVLEARYNRALTLKRLGRQREAMDALSPFARGEYGPYRQAEAAALIRQLEPASQ